MTELYILESDLSINSWVPTAKMEDLYRPHQNGVRWDVREIEVDVYAEGPRVDFSIFINTPIVSRGLGQFMDICAAADIERIPARLHSGCEDFELIHILWEIDCLDRERSEISPDGMIWRYFLTRGRALKHKIFRLANTTRIIVTSELKESIERRGFTGIKFEPVDVT